VLYFINNGSTGSPQEEQTDHSVSPSPSTTSPTPTTPPPATSPSQNPSPTNPNPALPAAPNPKPIPPPPPPASAPQTRAVSIANFAFGPASITIKKGDTVVWTNQDSAPHTVTGDGGLNSPTLNQGGKYSFTFGSMGTFTYKCAFHPSMTGSVVVTN